MRTLSYWDNATTQQDQYPILKMALFALIVLVAAFILQIPAIALSTVFGWVASIAMAGTIQAIVEIYVARRLFSDLLNGRKLVTCIVLGVSIPLLLMWLEYWLASTVGLC